MQFFSNMKTYTMSLSNPITQFHFSFTADRITVRVGEYTFDNDGGDHFDYKVQSIQKHQDYDTETFVNDIAILTLPQSVVFNDDVWPVCLPQPGPLYTDEEATVTGKVSR